MCVYTFLSFRVYLYPPLSAWLSFSSGEGIPPCSRGESMRGSVTTTLVNSHTDDFKDIWKYILAKWRESRHPESVW